MICLPVPILVYVSPVRGTYIDDYEVVKDFVLLLWSVMKLGSLDIKVDL